MDPMGRLLELVETFRKRVDGLKRVAHECSSLEDRFALQVRADEAEQCVVAIKKAIEAEKGEPNDHR